MKIKGSEASDLKKSLEEAIQKKNLYVAHNPSEPLMKDELVFFSTNYDAWEFCFENSTDRDVYEYRSIPSLIALVYETVINTEKERIDFIKEMVDPDANLLYNKDGNAFTDALIEHIEKQQLLHSKIKVEGMKQENFDYLKDNLKYMGFGEKLHEQLEKELSKGSPQFQLQLEMEISGKAFAAMLNFRKSDTSDMYFFNSYHATLQRKDGEIVDQAFYLNKGKGVTAKEAYNLLDGRQVHKELTTKEGQPYKAWIQLDFDKKDKNNNHEVKQFHEAYGYDLKEALSKYAFTDLKDNAKETDLIRSLQKGSIQSVTFEKEGSVAKMFVEANPQFKTVNLYDGEMKRVQKESLERYQSVNQIKNATGKQEEQKETKPEMNNKKEPSNKIKTQKDNSLLPKKNNRPKKGISVK